MVGDLVRRLGGPGAVAKFCGLNSGDTVSAWTIRGQIPWRWRLAVREMARAKDVELTANDEVATALTPGSPEAETMRQGIG